MQKYSFFYSFKTRVTLVLILAMIFVAVLNNLLVYQFDLASRFEQLRESLMTIAKTATVSVDAGNLGKIPLTAVGKQSPAYQQIAGKFFKILEQNESIRYIYVLAKTDTPAELRFLLDVESPKQHFDRKRTTALPGDLYDASRFPQMIRGFTEAAADRKLHEDAWGVTLSGYAPIRDLTGKTIAVLGVDVMADDVSAMRRAVGSRVVAVSLAGVVFCCLLGILLAGSVSDPVHRLSEGTRQLASGHLDHRVEVQSRDEIGALTDDFNKMAASLSESRQRLQDYFFRITQSLVYALEAKDPYTEGHSKRVAELTYKIALELGMTEEKADLIRHVAALHDIGKLMIHENILTKKEKLEPCEWEALKEHPVMGEKILKPVLDEELLKVIRSHHERVDGKGYPDGLKGDEIALPVQIVSIADAYDAMTSVRSYRTPVKKEEAIAELKRVSGAQFFPEVVTAFLKAINASPGSVSPL